MFTVFSVQSVVKVATCIPLLLEDTCFYLSIHPESQQYLGFAFMSKLLVLDSHLQSQHSFPGATHTTSVVRVEIS